MQQLQIRPLDGSKYKWRDASQQSSLAAIEVSTATTEDYAFGLLKDDKDMLKMLSRDAFISEL